MDRPVQGGARHSQVFGYSCGLFAAVDQTAGVLDLAVPELLPSAAQVLAGGTLFPQAVVDQLCANAAMAVNTMLPIGVPVSTLPPSRFKTRRLTPRLRSSSDKPIILIVDRHSRSRVIITPSCRESSA